MIHQFPSPYKRKSWVNKSELGAILHHIKKKISSEPDEFKKQAWAEVGIELNRIFLHIGIHD
jgi:hypothetical protein